MPALNSYSYVFGPLLAFGGLGIMILALRWAFRRGQSVVAAPGRSGREDEYGLLVAVAAPRTYIEGEMQRRELEAHGVRANLAKTVDGPRLMVFPADAERARQVLTG